MTANDEQRVRLAQVVGRLTSDDHAREAMPGWTIGALLAHLAFWDRLVVERWTEAIADGATIPVSLSDGLADLINGASLAQWTAMPGPLAAREAVVAAQAAGLGGLIDRSRHRVEHLDAIEAALEAVAAAR